MGDCDSEEATAERDSVGDLALNCGIQIGWNGGLGEEKGIAGLIFQARRWELP